MKRRKGSLMMMLMSVQSLVPLLLLLVSTEQCYAWVALGGRRNGIVIPMSSSPFRNIERPARRSFVCSSPNSNDITTPDGNNSSDGDDDDDCDDEEECEIDWSAMPTTSDSSAGMDTSIEEEEEQKQPSPETLRRRLEMNWKFQEDTAECDVYEPVTCGSNPCLTCRGAGQGLCRFCGGTRRIQLVAAPAQQLPNNNGATLEASMAASSSTTVVACNVCSGSGHEVCRSCAGTGWIADFAGMGMRAGGGVGKSLDDASP